MWRLNDLRFQRLAHALALTVWTVGWAMTWSAARANLYIEPTDQALRAAREAVPQGVLGSCLLLVAALVRLAYRPPRRVALVAIMSAWVLITFVAGPHHYGSWLWTLALVPLSFGMLAWGFVTDRRVPSTTSPAEPTGPH